MVGEKTESRSNFLEDSDGARTKRQVSWEHTRLRPPGLHRLWEHWVFLAGLRAEQQQLLLLFSPSSSRAVAEGHSEHSSLAGILSALGYAFPCRG